MGPGYIREEVLWMKGEGVKKERGGMFVEWGGAALSASFDCADWEREAFRG